MDYLRNCSDAQLLEYAAKYAVTTLEQELARRYAAALRKATETSPIGDSNGSTSRK